MCILWYIWCCQILFTRWIGALLWNVNMYQGPCCPLLILPEHTSFTSFAKSFILHSCPMAWMVELRKSPVDLFIAMESSWPRTTQGCFSLYSWSWDGWKYSENFKNCAIRKLYFPIHNYHLQCWCKQYMQVRSWKYFQCRCKSWTQNMMSHTFSCNLNGVQKKTLGHKSVGLVTPENPRHFINWTVWPVSFRSRK